MIYWGNGRETANYYLGSRALCIRHISVHIPYHRLQSFPFLSSGLMIRILFTWPHCSFAAPGLGLSGLRVGIVLELYWGCTGIMENNMETTI